MSPRRPTGRIFWPLAALAALLLATAPACRNLQSNSAEPATKAWWQRILPPKGEFFFDERSHDIEQSLRRSNNVTIR